MREGFAWLWHHPPVRTLTLTIVTFNVTYGAAWSVLVLYAEEQLGLGAVGFGLLSTFVALGGVAGTVGYDWLERHARLSTLMRVALTIETLTHLGLALTTTAWVAMAIMVVFGAQVFVWGTLSTAVRMRAVPIELQGRIGSVYAVAVFGGILVGQAVGGVLASARRDHRAVLVRVRRLRPHPRADLARPRRHRPRRVRAMSVEVRDVADGLWLWRQPHPAWEEGNDWVPEVASFAVASGGVHLLLDPLAPHPRERVVWDRIERRRPRRGAQARPRARRGPVRALVRRHRARSADVLA